jgi:hypothetical protein
VFRILIVLGRPKGTILLSDNVSGSYNHPRGNGWSVLDKDLSWKSANRPFEVVVHFSGERVISGTTRLAGCLARTMRESQVIPEVSIDSIAAPP